LRKAIDEDLEQGLERFGVLTWHGR
jgi:hypothetical protein